MFQRPQILSVCEKFTCAYLVQIALEIMWLPIQIFIFLWFVVLLVKSMYFEDQLIEHNSDKDRGLQKNKNTK